MRTGHDDLAGVEATLNVFAENPGWRNRITDVIATKPVTPDPFVQWQNCVALAKDLGQRERRDAAVNLFQVDYRDADYKPQLLPPHELSRLRNQAWRS